MKFKKKKFKSTNKTECSLYVVGIKAVKQDIHIQDNMNRIAEQLRQYMMGGKTAYIVHDEDQIQINIRKIIISKEKDIEIYSKDRDYWVSKQDLVIKDILE